jgi:uncharacterized protein (DUF427 family)
MNPAPGFRQHPGHRVETAPSRARVRVTWRGEVIADTRRAIEMREGESQSRIAPVVYYIPREDVKMERFARTSHSTHCPFKGDASYYSLKDGPENAAWSYESPYDEMEAIKDHLAFYPGKVDSIEAKEGRHE